MKKILVSLSLVLAVFLINDPALYAKEDDFAKSAIGQEMIKIGLKFLDNPADFFNNLHSNNEDFSPVFKEKHGAVRFNFFPTFFPFTWGNLNLKVKLLNDKQWWPQIDLIGMYGDLLILKNIDSDVEPVFSDYAIGLTASKSVDEKTRLFGGFKYSTLNMDVKFSSPIVSGDFSMSQLSFNVSDTTFFTGISHRSGPQRTVTAQIGYGFKYKKIVSRLMVSHKHLDVGIDIFPEGLFVIHPFLAWHWNF